METLKIIALTILSEFFIYYLISIYLKWSMGFEYKTGRIFNPFVRWINAVYFEKFSEGCDCYRKKIEEMIIGYQEKKQSRSKNDRRSDNLQ